MKTGRTAVLGAVGALALGLTACGSGGGDSTAAPKTSATTAPPATTDTTTTGAAATAPSGGLTPPGAKLGVGDAATVGWVPPSQFSGAGGQKGYKLQVTVKSIERGSLDDLKNIQLDEQQKRSTPYYVAVSVKALEDVKVGTDDPDVSFDAIDDRGQEQSSVIFLGTFERCDDKSVPRPFTNGKSYDSCLTYLVPGGGSIDEVQWRDGPSRANEVTPYFEKPIVWGGS